MPRTIGRRQHRGHGESGGNRGDAEMAGDMRSLIRERIAAGESPETIRAWLISRYGEWVTYTPELEPASPEDGPTLLRRAARRLSRARPG